MANTGEEVSGTIQDYSKALESLEEARGRQLRTGQGSEFTLDLSKQPYSMRQQTKPEWLRDDVSKVLVSWTWKKVSEEHSRVPGTTVSLFLDDPVVAPFTTVEGGRLRSRLQNSAQIYGNAREIEDRCFDPNALPLAGVHLQSCAYNDDEDSARFRRTDHHLLDLWRDDVLLTSVATGRALTADETLSLIPLPLYKDFIHHQSKPMTHFSESKITRKKRQVISLGMIQNGRTGYRKWLPCVLKRNVILLCPNCPPAVMGVFSMPLWIFEQGKARTS
ncbi:hypothetical protein I314_02335 [Cryptococcus bacillisporus CA1873]|nr:hypothetical protein I314_02335 [Cryptococcus bacillisporus CA1873]|eukprot:KIR67122.1 hypothetical protein I314_02335 [Cryptococcus gattii CA1873]